MIPHCIPPYELLYTIAQLNVKLIGHWTVVMGQSYRLSCGADYCPRKAPMVSQASIKPRRDVDEGRELTLR